MNYSIEVTKYTESSPHDLIEVMDLLRQIIHKCVPGTEEAIKWGFPVFSFQGKDFTYLRYAKKHITLGLYNPSKISYKKNLLQGKGHTLTHIKITKLEDIDKGLISTWLKTLTN